MIQNAEIIQFRPLVVDTEDATYSAATVMEGVVAKQKCIQLQYFKVFYFENKCEL